MGRRWLFREKGGDDRMGRKLSKEEVEKTGQKLCRTIEKLRREIKAQDETKKTMRVRLNDLNAEIDVLSWEFSRGEKKDPEQTEIPGTEKAEEE
jgi:hypothetical protein